MPNTDFSAVNTEMVPGVLRGYRTWRCVEDKLVACNFPVSWPPGIMEATHFDNGYRSWPVAHSDGVCRGIAAKDCSCGIYAVHNPEDVDTRGWVFGSIKAYGKVTLGTRGFRAAKAEIEAITGLNGTDFIGTLYKVPVYKDVDQLLEKFPPISVEHLLGDWALEERIRRETERLRHEKWEIEVLPQLHEELTKLEYYMKMGLISTERPPLSW